MAAELHPGMSAAKKRRLLRWGKGAAVALIVLSLALFDCFLPFRSLLPAYKIAPREEGELRLHFLDMGQADCTLIEFPSGKLVAVDAGTGGWECENKLVRYLKGLRFDALTLVSTHADGDHAGGFPVLLERFGAECVYLPLLPSSGGAYRRFAQAAERSGAELKTLTRYSVISDGSGAYAVCLSPYSTGETDENDASTVLYLSYGGVNTLLCGDISSAREERLLADLSLDEHIFDSGEYTVNLRATHILKAAHHGSASASSTKWLNTLGAETAILSCGRGNYYSHPAEEAVARLSESGAELYRTDELGDLIVTIRNGSYTVIQRSAL